MMTFWNHPLIMLLISIWAIGRGSAAVAAEIERGTMDLILSRPVARWTYLASQVLFATVGLAILAAALFAGASIALHYNFLREPPTPSTLIWPALNLARPGFADLRLHPAGVVARPCALATHFDRVGLDLGRHHRLRHLDDSGFQDSSWKPWLERVSIFKAYNPIELVDAGETLVFNLSVLAGIGAGFIVMAFVAFAVRDLPTNG